MKGSPMKRNFGIGASPMKHWGGILHEHPHTDGGEGGNEGNSTKLPPVGSDERKAAYDARNWKYDDTISGYNRDGSKKAKPVVSVDKTSPRYQGLSNERIKDIKAKEKKRKERKSKYKSGTSDLKERTDLPQDQAFYDKQRNSVKYAGMSNERIQELLDKKVKRKERSSKYKRGTSEKK